MPQNAKAMMDAGLGGTQAVQDFVIHIDMAVQTDDGARSFYEEIMDAASTTAGDPVPLRGGFTFTPVESLEGELIDVDGEVVPSIAIDFGFLGATQARLGEAGVLLAEDLRSAGHEGVAELIEGDRSVGARMLVEILTADYSLSRTHVGPGDRSAIDVTVTRSVSPGDSLTSTYLFGQTLPGDPASEVGLSARDLFVHRWNEGRVSMLGSESGVTTVTDDTVAALAGSTIMTREVKLALLFGVTIRGFAEGSDLADDVIEYGGEPILPFVGVVRVLPNGPIGYRCAREGPCTAEISPQRLRLFYATYRSMERCALAASELNRRNSAASNTDSGPALESSDAANTNVPTGDGDENQTSATARAEPTQPVACPDLTKVPEPRLQGGTFGDVHITNFDGWAYDNQAAGEFLIFENGATEVQLRTEPLPGSDVASIATAVATRIGDHPISMHLGGETWIDGAPVGLRRGETISVGDGALLWSGGTWVIVWPDGTRVKVNNAQPTGVDGVGQVQLFVTSSASPSRGMLGNADGDPANDWVTRSGTELDPDARFDFDSFYSEYIDTWRISDEESLFHYGAGESTATFIIEGFPAEQVTLDDLEPVARTEAEAVCEDSGITRADLLEDCILDVALTGDTSFAYYTYLAESETSPPPPTEPPATTVTTSAVQGENSVTVGPLVVGFGPEPPVQAENSFAPQWSCQVTEGSFRATSRFQETPDRLLDLTIDYLDAATSADGTERFTMTIELNSDPYAWMLTTLDPPPGTIEELSLDGSTLTVMGTAYLNEPIDPSLFPFSVLPAGTRFQPLSLQTTCDR